MSRNSVIGAGIATGLFHASATYSNSIMNMQGESIATSHMTVSMSTAQSEAAGQWEEIKVDTITSDLVFLIGGHNNPSGGCNVYDLEIYAELNISIDTQDAAQRMLERIDLGMINKDKIRAQLGAMQNRLENTVSNLQIQAENLQTSESRISDADAADEMTEFVRGQILTQTAVAMLAQANSLPQMALQVIQG